MKIAENGSPGRSGCVLAWLGASWWSMEVQGLAPALRVTNIKVVVPPPGKPEKRIEADLLFHRILVTSQPQDFVGDAPVHEFGILSLAHLPSIDSHPAYAKSPTVRLISKTLSRYRLWSRGAKFLLELHDDEYHRLRKLN